MVALAIAATCASCKVGSLIDSGAPVTLGDATHLIFVTEPANASAGAPIRVQVSAVDSTGALVAVFNGGSPSRSPPTRRETPYMGR